MSNEIAAGLQEAANTAAEGTHYFSGAAHDQAKVSTKLRTLDERLKEVIDLLFEIEEDNNDCKGHAVLAGVCIDNATQTLRQVAGSPPPYNIATVMDHFSAAHGAEDSAFDQVQQESAIVNSSLEEARSAVIQAITAADTMLQHSSIARSQSLVGLDWTKEGVGLIGHYAAATQEPFTMPDLASDPGL